MNITILVRRKAIKKRKKRMRGRDLATRQTRAEPPSLANVFSSFRSSRSFSVRSRVLSLFFPFPRRPYHARACSSSSTSGCTYDRTSYPFHTPWAPNPAITGPDHTHRRLSSSARSNFSSSHTEFDGQWRKTFLNLN